MTTSPDLHPTTDEPGQPQAARMGVAHWFGIGAGAVSIALLIYYSLANDHAGGHEVEEHLPRLWGLGIIPFIGILASIAILPLLRWTHHWWESNLNRLAVALGCAILTIAYYLFIDRAGTTGVLAVLEHAVVKEYIPFIVLLFSLYVISGGICLKGDLAAHPITNTAFLAVGASIASLIGTTGASMLLIRPLLQTNSERKHVVHTVVFFIFLVSNIGGTLLPIGDPPLFLGYLKHVPFFWTLVLWKEWALCCAVMLALYFFLDTIAYRNEAVRDIRRDETRLQPLRVDGLVNAIWLLGVVLSVAFVVPEKPFPLLGFTVFPFMREVLMLLFVGLSLVTTPAGVRAANQFNYAAILEVAALFIGIFIAMQVPVQVLQITGSDLGLHKPWHFFWATGSLSSVLDNAPTYVVFFETANAMTHEAGAGILNLENGHFIREDLLVGISLGAVFMGAMTYIGNGPNFMVKAIAEQSGIPMPSFLGYLFKYAVPILIPVLVIVTLLFLL